MRTFRQRLVWIVLVLCLLGAVGAGLTYADARRELDGARGGASAVEDAREAALVAVPLMLSYDHLTLDEDLRVARTHVTPTFLPSFEELQEQLIGPATRQQQLTTTASVDRSAVVESSATSVRVLVFVRQRTTAPGERARTAVSRAVLTMAYVNGRWLTDDLEAL